jgi:hypothetical protein
MSGFFIYRRLASFYICFWIVWRFFNRGSFCQAQMYYWRGEVGRKISL